MIIKMQRQLFESLSKEMIGHTCFEAMFPVYQNNIRRLNSTDTLALKSTFYKSLTKGQQALFMFFVFYDHAIKSKFGFYQISNFYLTSHTFSAVKKGIEYFKDDRMFRLLSELEDILKTGDRAGITDISYNELDNNSEIFESVNRLFARFQEISPETIKLIGACIKENPSEFICFES